MGSKAPRKVASEGDEELVVQTIVEDIVQMLPQREVITDGTEDNIPIERDSLVSTDQPEEAHATVEDSVPSSHQLAGADAVDNAQAIAGGIVSAVLLFKGIEQEQEYSEDLESDLVEIKEVEVEPPVEQEPLSGAEEQEEATEVRESTEPQADPRAEQAKHWLISAISSVKSVLSSKRSGGVIDEEASTLALTNLEKEIQGWLKETLNMKESHSDGKVKKPKHVVMFSTQPKDEDQESVELVNVEDDSEIKPYASEVMLTFFHPQKKKGQTKKVFEIPDEERYFTVTVNFFLADGKHFERLYRFFCPIQEIREDIAQLCRVPVNQVQFLLNDMLLEVEDTLAGIGANPDESVDFVLRSADPLRYPLYTENALAVSPIIDYRTLSVEMDSEEVRSVDLVVEQRCINKPFVGGYRHTETGVEYHHAFSQTHPKTPRCFDKSHRDTQTVVERRATQNTVVEMSTQMCRPDLYIPDDFHRILTAKPYVTADECERRRAVDDKVRVIQRYWRAYKIRKKVAEASAAYRRYKAWETQELARREEEKETWDKAYIVKNSFPKTKADFEMLYGMIERWRNKEIERITNTRTEAEQKVEKAALLEQQILLLRAIEEHRLMLKEEKQKKQEVALMNRCAKPVEWTDAKGRTYTMDTLRTQRSRDLKELYNALCQEDLTIEERIELIMCLKYSLAIYNTLISTELLSLLEREVELLLAGLKGQQLHFLRKRIKKLFLEFMKDPEFNPEAAKYSMAYNIKDMEYTLFYCKKCSNLMPGKKFTINAGMAKMKNCASCDWIDQIARRRMDYAPYRHMLRAVRREEVKRRCYSSVAFIMQPVDMFYLVYYIWHSRSILSETGELHDLRLPRWDVRVDWAPWNCVLLREDEARLHVELPCVDTSYAPGFVEGVHTKHTQARIYFSRMYQVDKYFNESGEFVSVRRQKKYVSPPPQADIF